MGALVEELALDVHAAFPGLVEVAGGPVYSLALRLCGPEDAEDVAQETFVRAYRALCDYPPERREALQVRPWVLTIALNVSRNHLRSIGRRPRTGCRPDSQEPVDDAPTPDLAAEHSQLRADLAAALLRLPLASREAVVLRHVVGCATAEVATILDRPVGTVKAQVWRGLAALREDLDGNGHRPGREKE